MLALAPASALANGHVSRGPLDASTLDRLGRTYALHCVTRNTDWSANISLFTAPDPTAVHDLGDSRINYAEFIVDHIVTLEEHQFLGGSAIDASAHPIVRNEASNGETSIVNYWYFEASDVDCRLREPGQVYAWE